MLEKFLALRGMRANSGGTGGDTGWVVCEETEPNKNNLGLRLSFPNTISIGESAFELFNGFAYVDFPQATSVGMRAFYECAGLLGVDIPNATAIDDVAFTGCAELQFVVAPKVEAIGDGAFSDCHALQKVDLPSAVDIGYGAFQRCINLSTVILRNTSTACKIALDAFAGTDILTKELAPTGEGFVYVHSALLEECVAKLVAQAPLVGVDAATVEYVARAILRKIEDYPEICG